MSSNNSPTPRPLGWLARLGAPQTPPPWTISEVGILLLVLALAMMVLSSGIAVAISGDPNFLTPVVLVIGWSVGLLAVIAYVWLSRRRTTEDRHALQLASGLLPLPLVLLFGVAFALTIDLVVSLITSNFGRVAELRGLLVSDIGHLLAGGIFVIVIVPIANGLAFVGVILPRLRATLGAWSGLLTTLILFTIYHFAIFGAQLPPTDRFWYGAFLPFVTLFCVCAIRLRTNSTRAAIVAYIGWGVTALVVMIALG